MILSNKEKLLKSDFDPSDQLKLLRDKCNNISSHLYKVKASYLEEVRNFLPQAIRSSIFTIITDQNKNDLGFSTDKSRSRFQIEIDKLVSNNITLLTIEHLNELSRKIDEENISQINKAKEEMAKALRIKNNSESSNVCNSVKLSSVPPLENLSLLEGWNGEIKAPYKIEEKNNYLGIKEERKDYLDDIRNNENDSKLDEHNKLNLKANEIDILQSIFALADESNQKDLESKNEDKSYELNSTYSLGNERFLPESPIGLYEWMISLDHAFIRRLRDLSHDINSELLRSGLVNSLVPLNILDAALAGQLISSKTISNILTLKLPTNSSFGVGELDVECLLITPSDLEFDNPRLRKHRTLLNYYQNVLVGMIKQQRYWQGRSLAEEVSKKWWKDTN